jgi:hypothetical protein
VPAGIKIIAVIYIFILAGIIVLADVRETQFLFRFIRRLPFGDKIGHFLLMGTFSLVVNLALSAKQVQIWKLKYLLGSLIVLTIVTAEEISQIYIRGRTFDFGILIFGEIARCFIRKEFNLNSFRR